MTRHDLVTGLRDWLSARRVAAILVALAASVPIGWQVVDTGIAQAFFRQGDLVSAYDMNGRDGIVAGYLSVGLDRIGDHTDAAKVARDGLAHTPLAIPALGVLAVAEAPTDPRLAAQLLSGATALGWRDSVVQTWAARIALAGGRVEEAAGHADAAARIQGPEASVRALLDDMALVPAARAALVRRLLLAPAWRTRYFAGTSLPLGNLEARAKLLRALAPTPLPPLPTEVAAVINIAGATMGLDRAYALWLDIASPTIRGFVVDPDFTDVGEGRFESVPFSWIKRPVAGAEADSDTLDNRAVLHATSDGTAAGMLVLQIVRIPPGRHTLSVAAHFSAPNAAGAFRWSMVCSDGHSGMAPVPPITGDENGAAHFTFDIPADGTCPVQILSLAAEPAPMPGAVEAWFRNIHVDASPGGSG